MAKAKRLKEYEAWSRSLQGQEIPNLVAGAKFLGGPVGNLDLPIADDKPTFRYLTSVDLPNSVFYFDDGFVYNNDTAGFEQLRVGSHGNRFVTISGRVGTGKGGSAILANRSLDIESVSGETITIGDASGNYDSCQIVVDQTDITFSGASTVHIDCPVTTLTGTVSSSGYILSSDGIQTKIASYTLTPEDNGKVIIMWVSTANTLTVPASLGLGFSCTVIQIDDGQTTVNASAGVTLRSYQSYFKISGKNGSARIVGYFTDTYNLSGDLSA